MPRVRTLAGLLALLLALAGCAARGGEAPPASPGASGQAESAAPESAPEPEPPAEPDYTDPAVCQKTFFAPYGNLIYAEAWEHYEDLGPDALFQFTVQQNYHIYMSKLDYAGRYGPEWERIDPPEDGEGFASYPAEEVEATALAYFGAPADYLRTAYSYDAEKNDYQMRGGGLGEEWWPRVLSAEREGDLLRISYEVWTEVYTVLDGEGNASEISGRKVYSAVMTVELLDGGGFQYRSVEVMPEEAA